MKFVDYRLVYYPNSTLLETGTWLEGYSELISEWIPIKLMSHRNII